MKGAIAKATIYDLNGKEVPAYGQTKQVDVAASNIAEAFSLNFNPFNLAYGKKAVASSSTGASKSASMVTDGGAPEVVGKVHTVILNGYTLILVKKKR